jgi:hypothetical protein
MTTNIQAIQEYLETIAVTGTMQAKPTDNVGIPETTAAKYPPDDGYPTAAQINAIANEINYRSGKKLSEINKTAGTALKFDSDKLPLNLLSTEALNQTAAVLAFGAQKYAEHNWRKGFAWSRPLAAAMRHITAFNDGEDCDPESGLSHLAHASCCIMFLLEFQKTHPHLDDRYQPNDRPQV